MCSISLEEKVILKFLMRFGPVFDTVAAIQSNLLTQTSLFDYFSSQRTYLDQGINNRPPSIFDHQIFDHNHLISTSVVYGVCGSMRGFTEVCECARSQLFGKDDCLLG